MTDVTDAAVGATVGLMSVAVMTNVASKMLGKSKPMKIAPVKVKPIKSPFKLK
jgi:hypothetical protein